MICTFCGQPNHVPARPCNWMNVTDHIESLRRDCADAAVAIQKLLDKLTWEGDAEYADLLSRLKLR